MTVRDTARAPTQRALFRSRVGWIGSAVVVAAVAGVLSVASPFSSAGPLAGGASPPIVVAAAPSPGAAAAVGGTGATTAVATFAAGCFWCVESDFDKVEGVISTTSGYTGGRTPAPTYESVSTGGTGHFEALQVVYDPAKVSYEKLLATFWHNVDPVDDGGQFCDRGPQYRPAIFVHSPEQRRLAEASRTAIEKSARLGRPIVVPVIEASQFTAAEDYHQDYYLTHPTRYKVYRYGCGRDQRLQQIWGSKAGH